MAESSISNIERQALVKILKDSNSLYKVLGDLKPEYFSVFQYGTIYRAAEELIESNSEIGHLVLLSRLEESNSLNQAGGKEFVDGIFSSEVVEDEITSLCDIINKNYKLRRAIKLGHNLSSLNNSSDVESQLSSLRQEIDNLIFGNSGVYTENIQDVLREEWDSFQQLLDKPGITGVSTGVDDLDILLSGYNPGNLIVIAARTSVGKTALALKQLLEISKKNVPTMIFSYEMSKKELSQRLVSMEAKINLLKIRTGSVDSKEIEEIKKTHLEISTYPIYIDTNSSGSLNYVLSTIRKYVRTYGVKVVFIDYLQLMARESGDMVRDIGKITKSLKALAGELEITIVVLSQLNRGLEMRENKRPELFDLRDSGNIEEDANAVIMLYRPKKHGKASKDGDEYLCEVLLRKNRNGPLGTINLYFDEETVNFYNSLADVINRIK
jgi:replicative DNA helicase